MNNLRISGRILLITGGLVHLFPSHLTPIVQIGFGDFTLQRIIGGLSVLLGAILLIRRIR